MVLLGVPQLVQYLLMKNNAHFEEQWLLKCPPDIFPKDFKMFD